MLDFFLFVLDFFENFTNRDTRKESFYALLIVIALTIAITLAYCLYVVTVRSV